MKYTYVGKHTQDYIFIGNLPHIAPKIRCQPGLEDIERLWDFGSGW